MGTRRARFTHRTNRGTGGTSFLLSYNELQSRGAELVVRGRSTSSLTCQSKERRDFSIARFFRQLSKGFSVYISALAKCRKAVQKSRHPLSISKLNGISKVLELNAKIAAPLSQILDCPTGWRSTKLAVSAVDFCASVEQQLDDFAKPIKRRVVKSGCARFVESIHQFAIFSNYLAAL